MTSLKISEYYLIDDCTILMLLNLKKLYQTLKINNIKFKCGITPLASQLGYTISVIFENKTQKLKLTKQGFSYFKDLNPQIDSLILTGKLL